MDLRAALQRLPLLARTRDDHVAVDAVLGELARLRKVELDVARVVAPDVVAQIGPAEALDLVRGMVPRAVAPPPHRRERD